MLSGHSMIRAFVVALGLVAWFSNLAQADQKPWMNEFDKVILQIDPQQTLPSSWKVHAGRWQVENGVLTGQELPEQKHGASITHVIEPQSLIIGYQLMIGPKNRNATVALNSASHHLCRLVFEPNRIALRKPDQDHAKGPDERVTFGENVAAVEPNKWHRVMIEVQGNEVLVHIDDDLHFYGKHDVFGGRKVAVQLTSGGGDAVSYRNFRVWEGKPHRDWPALRAQRWSTE